MTFARMAAALAVLALSLMSSIVVRNVSPSARHYSWKGLDFPEYYPLPWDDLPSVEHVVEETVHFHLAEENDVQWRSTAAAAYGYSRHGPENRLFMLTMFHELHCLRAFNFAFGLGASAHHISHCLNYLRAGILCGADLTLEAGDFAERDFSRDRIGSAHTCRDWGAVYQLLEENEKRWKDGRSPLDV
ncbi:hypothetical protein AURDEDRAFT_184309 [Auricularia subglabra TFB-10046 SS5]|nr:hypothetical protein AURDEDRAFT_184309 [Auricularia subglabra TFB-10046 SS5]